MNMKKWLVSALACLLVLPAMAQLGEERSNLALGVNVGMNMNKAEDFRPIHRNELCNIKVFHLIQGADGKLIF